MHIFSGIFKNRPIQAPKGVHTRPTSGRLRETVFNICQASIEEAAFLDLFAGSGAMGLEALSRGAKSATFIDNNRESIRCIQANLEKLGVKDQARVLQGDAFALIKRLSKQGNEYDIIYVDPPYDLHDDANAEVYSSQVMEMIDGMPLLKKGGSIFIEQSSKHPIVEENLKNLRLKSSRAMGRSMLQHFVKEEL